MEKSQIILEALPREVSTKSYLRAKRREGFSPAIIYGPDIKKNESVFIKENEFIKLIRKIGENKAITLKLGRKKIQVIIKEFDYNILKNRLVHVDFYTVSKKHSIKTEVPILFEGVSKGEKEGGIVEKFIHHINVEGKFDAIPENFKIDMTNLEKGAKIHIKDLEVPENIKILDDPEEIILLVKGQATQILEEAGQEGEELTAEEKAKVDEIFED